LEVHDNGVHKKPKWCDGLKGTTSSLTLYHGGR
jgi:hypothetical protein